MLYTMVKSALSEPMMETHQAPRETSDLELIDGPA